MKQTFEGFNSANDFAQVESKKQGKKLCVMLTKNNGIQYVVADSIDAKNIKGKTVKEYGEDVVAKPIQPPPTISHTFSAPPQEEKKEDVVVEESLPVIEEEKTETISEKPKKTRKKKETNE